MEGGLIYSFECMIPMFQGLPEFLAPKNYQVPLDANYSPVQYGLRTDKPFFSILRDNAGLGKAFNSLMAGYTKARSRWTEVYPYKDRLSENADANAPWNTKATPHDFFTPQLVEYRGAKAYFMHLILHNWPDAEGAAILPHLRDAIGKGYSRLLINETVLRDVGAPWQQTSLDWTMMGMLVNRERTESQWHQLLNDAGLKITGIYHKGTESVIEAMLA
ncbi:hypothetical protein ACKAV7_008784 [Fusarium commune]|nr:hypothetical protein LZL87_001975 [Fusarium oxysporum]